METKVLAYHIFSFLFFLGQKMVDMHSESPVFGNGCWHRTMSYQMFLVKNKMWILIRQSTVTKNKKTTRKGTESSPSTLHLPASLSSHALHILRQMTRSPWKLVCFVDLSCIFFFIILNTSKWCRGSLKIVFIWNPYPVECMYILKININNSNNNNNASWIYLPWQMQHCWETKIQSIVK